MLSPGKTYHQKGFTLIEILVVLVLLGLVSGVMLSGLGANSPQRKLQNEAFKVQQLFEQIRDEALLSNTEWGVLFELSDSENQGYRFLAYDEKNREWIPGQLPASRERNLPRWVYAELFIDNDDEKLPLKAADEEKPIPHVLLLSTGETTPFQLKISLIDQEDIYYRVYADGVNDTQLVFGDEGLE